ncbi:MAG: glycosyltransferase family 4 protein, partial [Micromonosporaceae bacterium]
AAPTASAAPAATPAAASRPGRRARAVRALRGLYRPWDELRTRFWLRRDGDAAWRRLEPGLWNFEAGFADAIDALGPDLIHAHDFRMLGVGARAKRRAAAAGRTVRLVWDAHEFLPGVRPWRDNAHWLPAHQAYEREYADDADAVVTVSETLAEMLQAEHHLPAKPTVVLNAPPASQPTDEPGLREACGIGPDTPLVVYSGKVAPQRGLPLMVDALPDLPGVHAAFVVDSTDQPELRARAERLGVADRVHLHPYVPHWRVTGFLSSADAGVIPIDHWPNHEIALVTKFFEYSHARLPLVVSDVRVMAATVRATGQGEVFRAGDVADYVRAVRAVLAETARYRVAYDTPGMLQRWTWEAQAAVIDRLYRTLVPDTTDVPETTELRQTPEEKVGP